VSDVDHGEGPLPPRTFRLEREEGKEEGVGWKRKGLKYFPNLARARLALGRMRASYVTRCCHQTHLYAGL